MDILESFKNKAQKIETEVEEKLHPQSSSENNVPTEEDAIEKPIQDRSAYNCPTCKGEGLQDEYTLCPTCNGKGKVA